jgi:hypothetical protein
MEPLVKFYFGARYAACPDEIGNSDLSNWLSVDQMSDKRPKVLRL